MGRRQSRNLSAAQQYLALRSNPVCEGHGVLGRGQLTWTWQVAPSALGRIYALRVEFKEGGRPKVFVDQPDLVALAEGRSFLTSIASRQLAFASISHCRANGTAACSSPTR